MGAEEAEEDEYAHTYEWYRQRMDRWGALETRRDYINARARMNLAGDRILAGVGDQMHLTTAQAAWPRTRREMLVQQQWLLLAHETWLAYNAMDIWQASQRLRRHRRREFHHLWNIQAWQYEEDFLVGQLILEGQKLIRLLKSKHEAHRNIHCLEEELHGGLR